MTRDPKQPLLAFSWGYYGWGNHTKQLIELVDQVEASQGYTPPLFVDIRIRRAVRAPGFRETAFEKLLGERYRWMPSLGNRAIVEDTGESVTIAKPESANELIDLIASADAQHRRVIFFCSCQQRHECHRGDVTELLVKFAKKRKTPLTVQEWPGGNPGITPVEVDASAMKKLLASSESEDFEPVRLGVPHGMSLAFAGALAHRSLLRCRRGEEEVVAVTGPVLHTTKGWTLPVSVVYERRFLDGGNLRKEIERDLKEFELGPFGSPIELPKRWRAIEMTSNRFAQ